MFQAARVSSRILLFAAIGFLLAAADLVCAQHEPMGGSLKDSSVTPTTRTPRRSTKPAVAPAATTTPRRRTTPPPATSRVNSVSADEYNRQGDELFDANKYDQAMEAYKKAVQINPKIASAHYHIGWILNDHERYQDAIASLTEAVRLQPNYPVALVELSYSYRNLKR